MENSEFRYRPGDTVSWVNPTGAKKTGTIVMALPRETKATLPSTISGDPSRYSQWSSQAARVLKAEAIALRRGQYRDDFFLVKLNSSRVTSRCWRDRYLVWCPDEKPSRFYTPYKNVVER